MVLGRSWCSDGSSEIRRYAVACKRHLRCCLLEGNCRYMRMGVLRAARQGSFRQARSWYRPGRTGTQRKSKLEMKFLLKTVVQSRKMKKRWSRRRQTQLGWFTASFIAQTGIAQCWSASCPRSTELEPNVRSRRRSRSW